MLHCLALLFITSFVHINAMNELHEITYNGKKYNVAIKKRIQNENLLVFIPGLACAKESFDGAFEASELGKYSLVSIDLPGCGESFKAQDFSYSMEDQAEIVTEIIKQIPHSKLVLFGHSMGGAIALLVADKCKDKLRGFINVEGNLVKECCHLSRKAVSVSQEDFQKTLYGTIIESLKQSDDNAIKLWLSWIKKSSPDVFYKSSTSLVEWSDNQALLKKYQSLNVPKIYVRGTRSYLADVTILDKKECHYIDASHFVMNDNPKEFYKFAGSFLDKINS